MANANLPALAPDKDNAPRLLVDLNSLLNAALLGGKDPDAIVQIQDGRAVTTNSALYGVERFFSRFSGILKDYGVAPRDIIGVWDGANAKAVRQALLPGYKSTGKADPVYEQLGIARGIVEQRLHDLGAHIVKCETCEADDVIGYLAKHLRTRRNIVVTGDGDLSVLVDDNTSVLKLDNSGRGQGDKLDVNPFGPFPFRFITLYKALVGDTSDKIPGAKGFGDAAFVKLVSTFGLDGLELMEELVVKGRLPDLAEDVGEMKELQRIIDDATNVYLSWKCARLMTERVNTLRHPLEWRAGFVKLWNDLPEGSRIPALQQHYGTCSLVHAGNYERMKKALKVALADSPFVALDIETSVPEESLAWIEQTKSRGSKGVSVDVLGSTLTGMSLTFGDNAQHTVYITVDHREEEGVHNVTSAQAREIVELVPEDTHIEVHNRAFELPCLRNEWGEAWKDNGWHGFLPNALDTKVEASYVDENYPLGLKFRSKHHLGYEQDTYEQTTTLRGAIGTLPDGGQRKRIYKECVQQAVMGTALDADMGEVQVVIEPAVYEEWEERQYQMNELTAAHVFGYGCDDTRVTGALHSFFRIVMEMEGTWQTYLQVEQMPEYLTSLAFMQGVPIDLGKLAKMEEEDRETLKKAEAVLDAYLTKHGWEGTVLPQFQELTPANVKQAVHLVLGPCAISDELEPIEFVTRKRKLEAIAEDIRAAYADNETAELLAGAVAQGNVAIVNDLMARHFTGKPDINYGSPKQVQRLLYDTIGMEPRVFNKLTDKQRQDEKFRQAYYAQRDYAAGKLGREPDDYQRQVWMSKASTDDDAVSLALYRDTLTDEQRDVLKAYLKIKEINTRISLFYNTYAVIPHWKDGRVHPAFNQCQAATRRHSGSEPNLQQAPARGEGAKIRTALVADPDYIHCSLDIGGQELRLQAFLAQDEAMLDCYIGDDLKDIHSMVAVQAAVTLWGEKVTYDEFMAMRKSDDEEVAAKAAALRSSSKTVVFASAYGASAPKIAIGLKTDEETAQQFLDAKDKVFWRLPQWKAEVEEEAAQTGLAYTLMGVPRHLRAAVNSPNSWVRSKAARQASNYCIQSSGGEQLRLSLARLWRSGVFSGKYRAQFVGPIHDEITFMVHKDDAAAVIREAHNAMTQPYATMNVPVVSTLSIGRDFSTPVEVGDTFTDEQVSEAVDALFAEQA